MARRRELSPFNLAFLDIMFCGFGAVVLLVLLVNARMVQSRKAIHEDLRGEVERLRQEVTVGRKFLVRLQNSNLQVEEKVEVTRGRSEQVLAEIRRIRQELADLQQQTLARKKDVRALESDLRSLDTSHRRLGAEIRADQNRGRRVRRFEGQGHRQYLTGLKLGGRRVLLLVDASASMLDRSVVNVIRRRNMDEASRRDAPKWRQVKKTVAWIVANLPVESSLQVYAFNREAVSLSPEAPLAWIRATDQVRVNAIMAGLQAVVPAGGTSLENALRVAAALSPRPDNIILLTDGLPTMGRKQPRARLVSGRERMRLFNRAIRKLPASVPVNTILFPMEGDPVAAALYWRLAVDTGGSFFTPTADWP